MTSFPSPFTASGALEFWVGVAAGAVFIILALCLAAWARQRFSLTARATGRAAPRPLAPSPLHAPEKADDGTGTAGAAIPKTAASGVATLAVMHRQIESRLAALADALDMQRQMNSLMSHELRSPVSTISAATQSLELVLSGSGEEVDSRLQRISRSVTRITELMDQLLAQDRLYDQALAPTSEIVDLAVLAREVTAGLQLEAAHTLTVQAAHETPAWCDRPLTGVVLRNLVHNAIKYSPADQPIVIEVGTQTRAGGDIAWMTVTDRGPGIELEDQSRIFEPHYRRPAHRETKGLGIGLFLVRKICERQDGTLTVESEPGKGSRFTVSLPARDQAAKT